MKTLKNWRAGRSGAYMTVYGEDAETGAATKLTCIDQIEPAAQRGAAFVVATDKDGNGHTLLLN